MPVKVDHLDSIVPFPKDNYKESGIDTQEADDGLRRLTRHIYSTWPKQTGNGDVKLDIGYFANVIDFCGTGLAMCTDGVGSKAIIAHMMRKYDTIGIDCVAMNVNDLICVGARPVSMVDYIVVESADADMLKAISIGLSNGANESGISIIGGEIAQLKDIVNGFDLVGMTIGHVALDKIITGQSVQEGDVIIGIESSGIHSNGLSLARRAFLELHSYDLSHKFDVLDSDLGTELLRPTHIYVREVLHLLDEIDSIKALVNITSDGLLNLTRVTAQVGCVIDNLPHTPPIFPLIQELAKVDKSEMFQVFNMGIGFCVIVEASEAEKVISILDGHGRKAYRIGYAIEDAQKRVILEKQGLVGKGKRFSLMR